MGNLSETGSTIWTPDYTRIVFRVSIVEICYSVIIVGNHAEDAYAEDGGEVRHEPF